MIFTCTHIASRPAGFACSSQRQGSGGDDVGFPTPGIPAGTVCVVDRVELTLVDTDVEIVLLRVVD
jgi:hypothetical protein